MTHDERIKAVAWAMCYAHWAEVLSNYAPYITEALERPEIYAEENWQNWVIEAEAALAASGIEEMVRAAAQEALDRPWQDIDDIVREVMGK